MRVILCGKWGVFYAWIAAAVDSARVLLLFSAWILFVAAGDSARDLGCFPARIVAAGGSARVLGCFPARIVAAGGSARDMWVFPARIVAAGDSARVLVLFSARILFVAGLERDLGCLLRADCCGSRFCAGFGVFSRSDCCCG